MPSARTNDVILFDAGYAVTMREGRQSVAAGRIRDLRRYIRGIASIQGHGGSNACYRVACLLAEAGYEFDTALAELVAWNQACAVPLWTRPALPLPFALLIRLVRSR